MGCETAKRSPAQGIRGLPRHRAVCSTKTQRDEELKWQDGGSKEKVVWPYLLSLLSQVLWPGMNPLLWVTGSVSLSSDISGCNFRNMYVFYNAHQENKVKPKYLLPVAIMSSLLSTWYLGFHLPEPWSS